MSDSRYCSRCGSVLRADETHRNRKECQVAARENGDAGMTILAIAILVPVAFLIVGSEIINRAPRSMIRAGDERNHWQIALIFSAVVVVSIVLIFAANRFWKRK